MSDRTDSWSARQANQRSDIATIQSTIESQQSRYAELLPSTISWAEFKNAFLTAVHGNYRLLEADRASLYVALQKSAASGLKPDGHEAALVIFGDDAEDEEGNVVASQAKGKKKVVFMPMVWGITKLIRNTDNVRSVRAKLIYRGERVVVRDENGVESYSHERVVDAEVQVSEEESDIIGAYAVVQYKDNSFDLEVMTRRELNRVRAVSKSKKGPYLTWASEMFKKGPLRRLSKRVEKSAVNMRFHTALISDDTMTIEGEAEEIRGEFTAEKQGVAKGAPKATTSVAGTRATRQAADESGSRPAAGGAPRDLREEPGVSTAAEIWPVDIFGDVVQREPMNEQQFASWFASAVFLSPNPEALMENNADNIADAGSDPKARTEIGDAIARFRKREEDKAKPDPQPKQAEPEKPKAREAIKIPKSRAGAVDIGAYQELLKAEIAKLKDEADIQEWIELNRPGYKTKATEITVDNRIRDRRKALGIPEPGAEQKAEPGAISPDAVLALLIGDLKSIQHIQGLDGYLSGRVQEDMAYLKQAAPMMFTQALAILDEKRLSLGG